jgi:hypothetical protein
MTRLLLLLLVTAAFSACTRATTRPPAPVTPFVERDGYVFAVVELIDGCAEASGAGGTHWSFRVAGSTHVLHGGGHGLFADLPLSYTGETLAEVPVDRRFFVAQVAMGTQLRRHGLGVWCPDRSDYTGDVVALGRASGHADARARLAEVARTGVIADPIELRDTPVPPSLLPATTR